MLPLEVLNEYGLTKSASVASLAGGLINQTFKVSEGDKTLVIQKMNKMYDQGTLERYAMLYDHLMPKGVPMAHPITTINHSIGCRFEDYWYRAMEYIDCDPFDYNDITPPIAYDLGKTLANLHQALEDFPHPASGPKREFHDTPAFLQKLIEVSTSNPFKAAMVAKELEIIINELERLLLNVPVHLATVHGDPKIFNFLFKDNKIVGVVDFDGVRPGNIYLEIGDALRDWSMREERYFDDKAFQAALQGYRERSPLTLSDEMALHLTKLINMELNARFLTDFFEEKYFAWDNKKYSSSAEHNLQRTRDGLEYYSAIKINLEGS